MSDLAKRVSAELSQRRSTRGFLPEPLDRQVLESLFSTAQLAPSWCNIQPWRVWVTAPPLTGKISEALVAAAKSQPPKPDVDFPPEFPEPYMHHRRACGFSLYSAMGIERHDKERRYHAWLRNYEVFDAPHLAVVAHDRRLGAYATLDVGVWLGYFLQSAQLLAVDTCPMASIATYPGPLRDALGIGDELDILFGIALGRADEEVPANQCRTTREPVETNVQFVGF